jgi:hypothetical protein
MFKKLAVCFAMTAGTILGGVQNSLADNYLPYSGNPAYDRYVYQKNQQIYRQRMQQYQQKYQQRMPKSQPRGNNYVNVGKKLLVPAYVLGSGLAIGQWCRENFQKCTICWNNYNCRQQMLDLLTNPTTGANAAYEYYSQPKPPEKKPPKPKECLNQTGYGGMGTCVKFK